MTVPLTSKSIQDEQGEAYDEYGRLSGFLGLQAEIAPGQQQLLLYGYESPPVDILSDTVGTKIGEAGDGTQFWKITHNGVDTHPIHWHLVNIQVINRVGWDGIVRAPDATELGWKETLRVNPLEDTIVALRPASPWLPGTFPTVSARSTPPSRSAPSLYGSPGQQAQFFDPSGEPVTVTNKLVNYGWEYVFHCHILAHEEMDMMHALLFAVKPKVPADLTGTRLPGDAGVQLSWRDTSAGETGFVIQRANDTAFATGLATFTMGPDVATYTDGTAGTNLTYYYRVIATNMVGDTTIYAAPAIGFPTKTVDSGPSNVWSTATGPAVVLVPGGVGVPTSPLGNGLYTDVNGNGRTDFADIVLYFNQMSLDRGERADSGVRLQRQRPDRLRRRHLALRQPLAQFLMIGDPSARRPGRVTGQRRGPGAPGASPAPSSPLLRQSTRTRSYEIPMRRARGGHARPDAPHLRVRADCCRRNPASRRPLRASSPIRPRFPRSLPGPVRPA